jgi:very-short-patch-repair endonuclease
MCDQRDKADFIVAEIAARQHGIVSIGQLHGAGLDKHQVRHRVRTGRLHRLHRGAYAVGHTAPSHRRRWMAAVIACRRNPNEGGGRIDVACSSDDTAGDPEVASAAGKTTTVLDYWGAALSHRSAAELWALLRARDGSIDVLVPGSGGKKNRRGIRLHRSLSLPPADVTLRSGIPVTTPARTIADLRRTVAAPGKSGSIAPKELRRAIRQADVLGLPIGDEGKQDRTRSDLEGDFLQLCRRHRLPAAEVNVRIGPHLVDFLWRDRGVVVETDGYDYHRGRVAFQDDRARVLDLRARGFDVIRVAEKQVDDEPQRVADVVAAALRVRADGHGSEDRAKGDG